MQDQLSAVVDAQMRFEMLFANSVDGVFFMTLDEPMRWSADADREALLDYAFDHMRVASCNPTMCSQMGAARETLIGSSPRDRWKSDADRRQWREKMTTLFDQGRAAHRSRAPRDDGSYIDVEGSYVCLYDDEGRITGYFGTQRDVSAHRLATERLELAMLSGEIGIWEYDLVAGTLYFDDSWLKRLGYTEMIGKTHPATWWLEVMHSGDVDEVKRVFMEHLEGKTPLYRCEHRVKTSDGRWLCLLSSGRVSSRDRDGRPLRFVGTSLDITERKQLQERVALAERMASIGTLAAGVAHEINNPLTYIVLNLTLLERQLGALAGVEPETAAKLKNMVSQARYGTERVSNVVRDLQSLTRVKDEPNTLVDPNAVLERCFEIADHQIRHRARLVRELSPLPAVRASEGRLVQLFLNLVVNAAHAIPEGNADQHTLKVRSSFVDGRVRVEVSDTGAGIASDALGRIFDPFFTTKEIGEGSGLGLAICRSIVTSLGGDIEVESEVGKGSTFVVTLPVGSASSDSTAPAAAKVAGGLRILVVDDEPLIGKVVEQVLVGHRVVSETSARAALARLQAGEIFDRILCDLMMPDMSGIELFNQLPAPVQKQVVFLSGGAFTERARDFLARVPNRRLEKPFDTDALAAALAD
ncbi:MAG TPA: ATP-binding protein [Kofleriaceae bacterium]|nr:ATP-binding protein [Kofleriaceae bacterium]